MSKEIAELTDNDILNIANETRIGLPDDADEQTEIIQIVRNAITEAAEELRKDMQHQIDGISKLHQKELAKRITGDVQIEKLWKELEDEKAGYRQIQKELESLKTLVSGGDNESLVILNELIDYRRMHEINVENNNRLTAENERLRALVESQKEMFTEEDMEAAHNFGSNNFPSSWLKFRRWLEDYKTERKGR